MHKKIYLNKNIICYFIVEYVPVPFIKKSRINIMKVLKSLKSAKTRDKNCRIVKRKGRTLVINKVNKRFKAKQA